MVHPRNAYHKPDEAARAAGASGRYSKLPVECVAEGREECAGNLGKQHFNAANAVLLCMHAHRRGLMALKRK